LKRLNALHKRHGLFRHCSFLKVTVLGDYTASSSTVAILKKIERALKIVCNDEVNGKVTLRV